MEKEKRNELADRELTITRIIKAPRDLVFEAWTNPKHIKEWWGPKGYTNPVCEWDAKVGNRIYVVMEGPNNVSAPMDGEFLEIVKPSKMVFITAALDENGKRKFEVYNTVLFIEEGKNTKLMMTAKVSKMTPEAIPHVAGMEWGWNTSIDKLEEYLAKM